ncbi:hypothetical protein ACFOTA_10910 [Chitinophaga sp. GCM10012297]|uniref:Uncharacterized protein n=1 Tax=Chitinophaga chungangae TaxID=2821488 RepID=A0ABS3YDH6_9BACT|nr:hypothetical protein [Chitinophaga chungangae]MBO9152719.1 hypothetical protein [Chitinophaga chungangae]
MQQTETNLRSQIYGFLRHVHAAAGNSIQHVSIVVHGRHLEDDLYTENLALKKAEGANSLSYQHFRLDAPIDNNITVVSIGRVKTPPLTTRH